MLLLLLVGVMVLSVAACKKDTGNTNPTGKPTTAATKAPATEAPNTTPETTRDPAATAEPTEEPKRELTDDEIGKPFAADLEGVETVFQDDFSDDNWSQDGQKATSANGNVVVVDGTLRFPCGSDGNFGTNGHTSYVPVLPKSIWEFDQMEISFTYTWKFLSSAGGPWIGLMIGSFVTRREQIANTSGDGLWFSMTNDANVTLYGVSSKPNGGFPEGAGSVNVPRGFEQTSYIKLVVTGEDLGDKSVSLWVADSADGAYQLYVKFVVEPNAIVAYNAAGESVLEVENNSDIVAGENFVLWSHEAGAIIDDVVIRGY